MNIQKIIKLIALVIGLIAVFFLVRIIMIGDEAFEASVDNHGTLSMFITLALIVLAIATISAVAFSLVNLISNPDKLKKSLLSVGVFIVILLVGYLMSSGEEQLLNDGSMLSATRSQMIEGAIRAFYILILSAAGLMLFFGVKKMLSK
ncbi:hypothetical protein [uncultured Psychroserpens sp.]|uniref:hypothetical protein n=1 Tax=uncultured Psychroserpens sp. TaxID=255436 RepID=UPI0026283C33|nr:hypothetical protein [uncultured Psychroserpens sp.]